MYAVGTTFETRVVTCRARGSLSLVKSEISNRMSKGRLTLWGGLVEELVTISGGYVGALSSLVSCLFQSEVSARLSLLFLSTG